MTFDIRCVVRSEVSNLRWLHSLYSTPKYLRASKYAPSPTQHTERTSHCQKHILRKQAATRVLHLAKGSVFQWRANCSMALPLDLEKHLHAIDLQSKIGQHSRSCSKKHSMTGESTLHLSNGATELFVTIPPRAASVARFNTCTDS